LIGRKICFLHRVSALFFNDRSPAGGNCDSKQSSRSIDISHLDQSIDIARDGRESRDLFPSFGLFIAHFGGSAIFGDPNNPRIPRAHLAARGAIFLDAPLLRWSSHRPAPRRYRYRVNIGNGIAQSIHRLLLPSRSELFRGDFDWHSVRHL